MITTHTSSDESVQRLTEFQVGATDRVFWPELFPDCLQTQLAHQHVANRIVGQPPSAFEHIEDVTTPDSAIYLRFLKGWIQKQNPKDALMSRA